MEITARYTTIGKFAFNSLDKAHLIIDNNISGHPFVFHQAYNFMENDPIEVFSYASYQREDAMDIRFCSRIEFNDNKALLNGADVYLKVSLMNV